MKRFLLLVIVSLPFAGFAGEASKEEARVPAQVADIGSKTNSKDRKAVLDILSKNRVVQAAVKDGEAMGTCKYNFLQLNQPRQFQKDTTYDVKVRITCGTESAAFIDVEGRLHSGSEERQQIKLDISFAG